jgi:tetratricopeptide (TPR) repeat protein
MTTEKLNIQLAMELHRGNRLDEAAEIYQKILQKNREQSEALYGLGVIAQQQKDYQTAEYWLLDALRVQPDSAQTWFGLGNLYQTQEKFLEAAEAYWQAMSLRPDSAPIFNNLGYTLQRLERWNEAALCYQKALEIQPGVLEIEVNLGNVLHTLSKLSGEQQVHLAILNYQLGVTQYQRGDFKAAQLYLRQVIALQPNLPDAYAYLGMTLSHQGELEEAATYCQKALELNSIHELANQCLKKVEQQHFSKAVTMTEVLVNKISEDRQLHSFEANNFVKTKVEVKSDVEILGQISGAIWNWAKSGFAVVDPETFQFRYNHCLQCPNVADAPQKLLYRVIAVNNSEEKMCTVCGCIVSKKARIASETCPDPHPTIHGMNRWEEPLAT